MQDVFMRALKLNGHEFDLSFCGRNPDGQIKSGNIMARYRNGFNAMHNLPGPWESELQARSAILEEAHKIAERHS